MAQKWKMVAKNGRKEKRVGILPVKRERKRGNFTHIYYIYGDSYLIIIYGVLVIINRHVLVIQEL